VWQIVAAAAALVTLSVGLGQLRQGESGQERGATSVEARGAATQPVGAAEPSRDVAAAEPQALQPAASVASAGGTFREQRLDGSEARRRWLQGSDEVEARGSAREQTAEAEPRVKRLSVARRSGGLPAQPSREQVMATMRAAMPALARCTGGRRGVVEVQLTVRGSGKVTYALVQGSFAGTPQGSCLARALRDVRFPEFGESSLRLSYPLQF
jgi:hypothetical protein